MRLPWAADVFQTRSTVGGPSTPPGCRLTPRFAQGGYRKLIDSYLFWPL